MKIKILNFLNLFVINFLFAKAGELKVWAFSHNTKKVRLVALWLMSEEL